MPLHPLSFTELSLKLLHNIQILLLYCNLFLLGQTLLSLIKLNTSLSIYPPCKFKPLVNYLGCQTSVTISRGLSFL